MRDKTVLFYIVFNQPYTALLPLREQKRERYFLRKLRSSYGILTDERNSCVLLQRKRLNGTET